MPKERCAGCEALARKVDDLILEIGAAKTMIVDFDTDIKQVLTWQQAHENRHTRDIEQSVHKLAEAVLNETQRNAERLDRLEQRDGN